MSKTTNTDTTIDEEYANYAAELREINDRLDRIARAVGGNVDNILRDEQHINETLAHILEEEAGEITREELSELVYPTGGVR